MGKKYDIFISYRREGGYDTAKHLYDLLTRDGYRVSFDIDTLRNGDFDEQLLLRIDQCKDFILIVDKNCFDRTLDKTFNPKQDWLRQELAYALRKNKNIIPIFLNGIKGFPNNLPADIAQVSKKNGPEYNRYYFNDFYDKLKKEFLLSKKYRIKTFVLIFILVFIIIFSVFGVSQIIRSDTKLSSSSTENVIDGHEYVDLGLSVKWAVTNLGAHNNYEFGDCYGWGSLEKFTTVEQSKHSCHIMYNKISAHRDRDAATNEWGVSWRIPTKKECEELLNNCDWIWTDIHNTNGYKVVGPNGKWIFLPATGMVRDNLQDILLPGLWGGYWAGTTDDSNYAEGLSFGGGGGSIFGDGMHEIGYDERYAGRYIRPVSDN